MKIEEHINFDFLEEVGNLKPGTVFRYNEQYYLTLSQHIDYIQTFNLNNNKMTSFEKEIKVNANFLATLIIEPD